MKKKKAFDKYSYYKRSVQNPEEDILFFRRIYKSIYNKNPRIFREDFCGAFNIGATWVKKHPENRAIVIDKDSEPLNYGKKYHFPKMSSSEQKRLQVLHKNVCNPSLPSSEIISVSNFSYFVFKERKELLTYFKNVKKKLKKEGLFFIDVFGGTDCEGPIEESVEHEDFIYYWDQKNFDPVNNHAYFYIHFKRKGEKKRRKQFSYDWRIWSLPELRDALADAGFSKTHVYWELSDKKGEGSGIFRKVRKGEPCDVWIAYLVSQN